MTLPASTIKHHLVLLAYFVSLCMAPVSLATPFGMTPITLESQQHYQQLALTLAVERLSLGDVSTAITLLRPLTEGASPSIAAVDTLLLMYKELHKPYECLRLYDIKLKQTPTQASLWFERSQLYLALGQVPLAIDSLQTAIRYAPTVARYSFELALLLSAQGEHTQASQASWKAIELGYKLPESYNNYAYALAQAGQYQAAEKALKQAISYYTTSTLPAATLDTQGFLHLKQHRYHEALHLFDAALKQDAHLAEVYLHKAEALEALGLYKEAVENYRHYLRLTPASEQTTLVVQQLKRLEEASTSMTTPLQWPLNTPSPTDPALTPAGKGQTVGGAASVQSRHDE